VKKILTNIPCGQQLAGSGALTFEGEILTETQSFPSPFSNKKHDSDDIVNQIDLILRELSPDEIRALREDIDRAFETSLNWYSILQ
jgi:hypothetical protein